MNRTIPQLSAILFLFILFQFSCKQEEKKSPEKNETDTPVKTRSSEESRVFTTQSGKVFELNEDSNEDGMYDFHLVPKGFEFSKDTLIIAEADPLNKAFLADLDENGFEEIYLITTSVGSGSYGNIYGYSSNADKSVSPIYMAPINENDLSPGGLFEGYMGHDSIYLDEGALMRKFPIYLEGDPNCCPTGGHSTIIYDLKAGEASWKLEATKK
jgi:hypothetical protein